MRAGPPQPGHQGGRFFRLAIRHYFSCSSVWAAQQPAPATRSYSEPWERSANRKQEPGGAPAGRRAARWRHGAQTPGCPGSARRPRAGRWPCPPARACLRARTASHGGQARAARRHGAASQSSSSRCGRHACRSCTVVVLNFLSAFLSYTTLASGHKQSWAQLATTGHLPRPSHPSRTPRTAQRTYAQDHQAPPCSSVQHALAQLA